MLKDRSVNKCQSPSGAILLAACMALITPLVSHASDVYVATNGNNSGGTNWTTAYTTLQSGISNASPSDTIFVAGQTFFRSVQTDWGVPDLTVLGGYAATNAADMPGPFDSDRWPTTLSRTNGTTRILYIHNLTNATLRRVTLSNGYCNNTYGWGAGLKLSAVTNVVLSSCIIEDNVVYQAGSAVEYAAGIQMADSYVTMSNCVVRGNTGTGKYYRGILGGGLYITGGGLTLIDSMVVGNGGTYGTQGKGGGIYISGGAHLIRNCAVIGNYDYIGDGIYVAGGSLSVENATIAFNDSEGIRVDGGTVSMTNSILWDNGDDIVGTLSFGYCDIENGDSNGVNGCISSDPLFERGIYLASTSPCTNAGSVAASSLGLDGKTVLANGTLDTGLVDLGYHFVSGVDPAVDNLYVSTTGSDINTGVSWAQAFRTMTKALATAEDGSRIYIASGVYTTNGVETFPLVADTLGLQILGTNNATTIIKADGPAGDQRVMTIKNVLGDGRIEGLTFTGGRTTMTVGGGLAIYQSTMTINDCSITNNRGKINVYTAQSKGGGIYSWYNQLIITNCIFRENETYQDVQANSSCAGGAIYAFGGQVTIIDSVLRNNLSYNYKSSGSSYGGAAYFGYGVHRMFNCMVLNNSGNPTRLTCAGIYVNGGGSPEGVSLENCTLMGNIRHGIYRNAGTVTLTNSIVWDNADDIYGTVGLRYSDIEDGDSVGTNGCISTDPLFEGGFYLATNSPCVNAGAVNATDVGLDGYTTRTDGTNDSGLLDLGYHQTSGIDPALADLYVSPAGDDSSGTNWVTAFNSITKAIAKAAAGSRIHISSGSYTNGLESFPLVIDEPGIQLLGTNRADTIINAQGSVNRVITVFGVTGDARIEGLTITGGSMAAGGSSKYGGGIYISSSAVTIDSCTITNNAVPGSHYGGECSGAGLYSLDSTVVMTNCLVQDNRTSQNQANSRTRGAGIGSVNSSWTILRTVITDNKLSSTLGGTLCYGGGVYLNGGTHLLRNCLIARNQNAGTRPHYGMAGYFKNANVVIENCTVATNETDGLYQSGGTVWVTNSIVWGNGDDFVLFDNDALTLINVYDTFIEDGDNNGIQGCTNADPMFVDNTNFHLRSHAGHYIGGYFSSGTWGQDPVSNSPCIDYGRTGLTYDLEPHPNGRRLNIGAYGNSPTASKTFLEEPGVFTQLTVHSYGTSGTGTNSTTLTAEIVHDGGVEDPAVYICWDTSDQGTGPTSAWSRADLIGTYPAFQLFSINVTGLSADTYFRFFTTNSSGGDWSAPVDFVSLAETPAITNAGASSVRKRTSILNGNVVTNGNVDTYAWFYWWEQGSGITNVVAMGVRDGAFSTSLTGMSAGTTYEYEVLASNSAATVWSATKNFTMISAVPLGWYVSSGGDDTIGTNWATALNDFQEALSTAESNDTIYVAGNQSFSPLPHYSYIWSNSYITILGGYEATGASPGPFDADQWPTVLELDPSGQNRVLTIQNVTNGLLRRVTIRNGDMPTGGTPRGAGIYVDNCVLTIADCVVTNNDTGRSAYQAKSEGGGIYVGDSIVVITNTLIVNNKTDQEANANSKTYGAGLCSRNSTVTVTHCAITGNRLRATHNSTDGYGAGVYVSGGTVDLINTLVVTNWMDGPDGFGLGVTLRESSGTVRIMNCTVADNEAEGIRRVVGTITITNSIVWGNTDDLVGTITDVGYTSIEDGDFNTTNGCVSVDPSFLDSVHYHLKSRHGVYTNGYFSGGSWMKAPVNSLLIDAGNKESDYSLEPNGNGRRINMGAYGNTPVASKSLVSGTIIVVR